MRALRVASRDVVQAIDVWVGCDDHVERWRILLGAQSVQAAREVTGATDANDRDRGGG